MISAELLLEICEYLPFNSSIKVWQLNAKHIQLFGLTMVKKFFSKQYKQHLIKSLSESEFDKLLVKLCEINNTEDINLLLAGIPRFVEFKSLLRAIEKTMMNDNLEIFKILFPMSLVYNRFPDYAIGDVIKYKNPRMRKYALEWVISETKELKRSIILDYHEIVDLIELNDFDSLNLLVSNGAFPDYPVSITESDFERYLSMNISCDLIECLITNKCAWFNNDVFILMAVNHDRYDIADVIYNYYGMDVVDPDPSWFSDKVLLYFASRDILGHLRDKIFSTSHYLYLYRNHPYVKSINITFVDDDFEKSPAAKFKFFDD